MTKTTLGVCELRIEGLGAAGDGVAHHDGQTLFVPGSLPDEVVRARISPNHVELVEILKASPDRVKPPCSLFGTCGGCALQEMSLPALLEWKSALVLNALDAAGFGSNLPEPSTFQTRPFTRRRVDLAIQRVPGGIVLGLHRRNGDPVDMTECDLLHPAIFDLLAPLRVVLGSLGALTGRGSVLINLLDSGVDLTLQTPAPLTSADRSKLAEFARSHNLPRISWRSPRDLGIETVAQSRSVTQIFGDVATAPPPAAFLQATREAEQAISDAVIKGLPPLNRKDIVVELYAGCGTLTFPMSESGRVIAYEGELAAANCLKAGAGGRRVDTHHRDLGRQPLLPHDLKTARAVVLDPPFAGAGAQTIPLARSAIRDLVYVSCNPTALAKDGKVLREAGFSVIGLTVVDQFLWSTEVEAVVVFSRDPKRIKRESSRRSHNDPSHSDS